MTRLKMLSSWGEHLRTSLWLIPITAVAFSLGLAAVLLRLDRDIGQQAQAWYLFGGGADSARDLLSTIAASLLTLTSVVFSITILVLQLASTQFSSRVLRTFLEDRYTQLTMGVFVGSFVYALSILTQVRTSSETRQDFVPALSVSAGMALVIVSIAVFVRYIHHIAHSIRAVHVVARIAQETRQSMERMYPEEVAEEPTSPVAPPAAPPDQVLSYPGRAGVVISVDDVELLRLACGRDVVIALIPRHGDFVARGAPLFQVWGRTAVTWRELEDCIEIGPERTPFQDPAFGFRQLVDIGERGLSPGINDPTTAVQALDQLHDLLRTLARRAFPSPARWDDSGRLRLVLPRPGWEAYVRLALDEIREYGGRSIQVMRRLRSILLDLLSVASGRRQDVLREELSLLDQAADRSFPDGVEREQARRPSTQGQGE